MLISSKIHDGISGNINIPGDKSISHRSIIISSISNGSCEVSNLLFSEDVIHTLNAFVSMGVKIEQFKDKIIIEGRGLNSLQKPLHNIYLGNSGTSARLLTGLLASQNFNTVLTGDKSLSKRPMKRITDPLKTMGGKFESQNNTLPLKIYGNKLNATEYELPIPSAQVKSGILFAALNTKGKTKILENNISRDHTEIMLKSFGANIECTKINDKSQIIISGESELFPKDISIPSDLSSAAFFIIAALINKNSSIKLENININPTRDGILRSLKLMGASINVYNKRTVNDEVVADLKVQSSKLRGCELDEKMSRLMIDEYPILSIAASFAETPSLFKGLKELKFKESNRLELIRINLDRCGVECSVSEDQLFINPKNRSAVKNNLIQTNFDHRIAMSFAVMGSKLDTNLKITDSDSIKTSFPNFIENYNQVGGNLIE